MTAVKFVCNYCDHRWKDMVYAWEDIHKCPKCKSTDTKPLITGDTDPFGYNKGKK